MTARFDALVIGAGSAGCVVAARLSADPGRRVALIEVGGTPNALNTRGGCRLSVADAI